MILLTILEPILKKIRTGVVDKCLNLKVVAIFNILITIGLLAVIIKYYDPINYSMVRGWFTWILTAIGIGIFAVITAICIFCLLLLYLIVLRPYIILFYDLMIYIFSFNFRDSDIQNPIEKFKTKNNKQNENGPGGKITPKRIFNDILVAFQDLVISGDDDFNAIPNKLFIMALNTAKTNTPYLNKIPSIPLKDLVLLLIIILISSLLYVIGTLLLLGINQTLNFGESIVNLLTFSSLLFSIFIVIELFYFLLFRFSIKCLVLAAFELLMNNAKIKDLIINLIGLVFKLATKN
jgi:hypothetical protein